MGDPIAIHALRTIDDMYAAVRLQRTYWGNALESVVPAHMLFSLASYGGHVLAAYSGEYMVGVLIGFLGTRPSDSTQPAREALQIVSKRMVVLPEFRNQGIGLKLKLEQRRLAQRQRLTLVSWTFDPLLARNAHLNIHKLGGVCRDYTQDLYGVQDDGGLATLGSSDRLTVDWWVNDERVTQYLNSNRRNTSLFQYLDDGVRILNPTTAETDGTPWPSELNLKPIGLNALVEIPLDFPSIVQNDPALAQAWRVHIRVLIQSLFSEGYYVSDFLRAHYAGRDRVFYLSASNPEYA